VNLGILLIALAASIQAMLGRPAADWPAKPADRWVQGDPVALADLRGKVVLIRFFTDADCPYCGATAPSLNEFHREFAARGLVVIGMYTPKPRPRPVSKAEVRGCVRDYGFEFAVAIDDDWSALRRLWLDRVSGAQYTSASLLIDRAGILRYVHQGGVYAKDSPDAHARRDYEEVRKTILDLLSEP
jgi:peroxiredoxin